jgi:hypothetical protein
VADGREFRTLVGRPGRRRESVGRPSLHPRGRLLAVAVNSGVGFWDLGHDVAVGFLTVDSPAVAFTATGDLLTSGPDGSFRWRVVCDGGEPPMYRLGPPARLPMPWGESIAESRDGCYVGVAHYDGATLLDAMRPGRPIRLAPHRDVRHLSLSPDGRWAATASHQPPEGVKVWSLPEGRLVHHVPNPTHSAESVFSPDGRRLVITTSNLYRVRSTGVWEDRPDPPCRAQPGGSARRDRPRPATGCQG